MYSNPREVRAMKIVTESENIKQIKSNVWYVRSQSNDGYYTVSRRLAEKFGAANRHIWKCDCPDHVYRHQICKHIYAVQFALKLKKNIACESVSYPQQPVFHESIHEGELFCSQCGSLQIVRRGQRKTKFGITQRYGCKDCNFRFTQDQGFKHMKHDPKIITLALDLYFKGVSLRKIADHLKQFHEIEVAQTTPMRWIKKYLKLLAHYVEKNKVNTGKIWHSDEMTVFIKKEGEKKYYEWIWNVMDAKTRYLLACQVSDTRLVKDARKPLQQAKETADKRPHMIVTDGLQAYKQAIKDEYYDRSAVIQNPHMRLKDFETKPNNNIVERLNGTFRERTKVMRSMYNSDSAASFCAGMQVYYNYIRPHQGIGGMTPAEMANIPIDLTGNRWMKMIARAVGVK